MAPNVDRLSRVLAHVEANQGLFDQRFWAHRKACGTTYCFAGWTVRIYSPESEFQFALIVPVAGHCLSDGHLIDEVAAEILGLDRQTSDRLFYGCSTLAEVRRAVAAIIRSAEKVEEA
jgi:hypothetical protein